MAAKCKAHNMTSVFFFRLYATTRSTPVMSTKRTNTASMAEIIAMTTNAQHTEP